MELQVKKQNSNAFFDRKEIVLSANEKTTPSYVQLKAEIGEKIGADENLIVIKKLDHQFGKTEVIVHVYVYGSLESLKSHEKEKKKKEGVGGQKVAAPAK